MTDLYTYYAEQDVRPTYAQFTDDNELSRYEALRRTVLHRLMLPPGFFSGKHVLEFGPDTGENSLVFARWGARLTLVEPNVKAHPFIREYFARFGLSDHLTHLDAASLLDFVGTEEFDLIDAEGFIYTVQPSHLWIAKTAQHLKKDGFLIISYMELYGGFFELLLKALYEAVSRHSAYPSGIETAKVLFLPKWNSIPHTRPFESWFMDVLVNPFVRLKYFLDPAELLRETYSFGFRLHSSWPNYRDMLAVNWIKAPYSAADDLQNAIAFVEQSRLSHFLGSRCFLPLAMPELTHSLRSLLHIVDRLIDEKNQSACREAIGHVDHLLDLLKPAPMAAMEGVTSAVHLLEMVRKAFEVLGNDESSEIVEFCRANRVLISTWGTPAHYAIFEKISARPDGSGIESSPIA